MDKSKIIFLLVTLFSFSVFGQTKGVIKSSSTNRITENLTFGTGKTLRVESGATINLTGATVTGLTTVDTLTNILKIAPSGGANGELWFWDGAAGSWIVIQASEEAVVFTDIDIIARSFNGAGNGLTNLNASNISSGTLNNARLDATLNAFGNLGNSANTIPFFDGVDSMSVCGFSAAGRAVVSAVDAASQRTAIGINSGTATLVSGTVTVSNSSITTNSRIFVNRQTDGGTIGDSFSITRSAGVSFTITSKISNTTASSDTSTVSYIIINP